MTPFILRDGRLHAFQDLRDRAGPFALVVDAGAAERARCSDWWSEPDRSAWFIELANRALNKLTGRRGLHFDREHHRYYFVPLEAGKDRSVRYRPMNQRSATRKVVWRPIRRATGEGRNYWFHRAVSLRFLQYGVEQWALGVRPELRVTRDGLASVESERVGAQVTRRKSRMFNSDLLAEVHFWRDYLSESSPRIVLDFDGGGQSMIIATGLMSSSVSWPGIPEEHQKPFGNVTYLDDLFSWAELAEIDSAVDDDPWGDTDDN